ncbi:MAG TPA: ribosome maturation factor RimP [Candidatus Binataceae bacterium]|nr:ribosome maturation factor RimP [Candidatus Binataceae bacterium]
MAAMVLKLNPTAARVMELLEPHIERLGFELVLVEYRGAPRGALLRLFVDRPEGGIGLDELEPISRMVGDLLDVYDPVEGSYTLEVSSPGVDRPLTKLGHFERYCGQRVKVRTHQGHEGQKSFVGVLATVDAGGIEVEDEISRRRLSLRFEDIKEARYQHQFQSPRPG